MLLAHLLEISPSCIDPISRFRYSPNSILTLIIEIGLDYSIGVEFHLFICRVFVVFINDDLLNLFAFMIDYLWIIR